MKYTGFSEALLQIVLSVGSLAENSNVQTLVKACTPSGLRVENLSLTSVGRHARINGRLGDLRGNPCILPLVSTMQKRKKRKLSSLAGSTYSTPQKQVNMSLCWSNVRLAVAIFNAKGNHSVDKNEKRNRNLFKIERRAQKQVIITKTAIQFCARHDGKDM